MVVPEPELAPLILPDMLPMVQEKLLATLEVNVIFGLTPLHVGAVAVLVTNGIGFTVTVMVDEFPTHPPEIEVGVTIYCTLPADVLLGLLNI